MDLAGKNLILRKFSGVAEQIQQLCEWRNTENYRNLCSTRRNIVTLSEFEKELRIDFNNDRHVQFILYLKATLRPIGTIFSYNMNEDDGYTFITIFLDPEFENQGLVPEAFKIFAMYLFLAIQPS